MAKAYEKSATGYFLRIYMGQNQQKGTFQGPDPTHLSNFLTTQTLLKSIYQNDFSFYIYSNECLEGDETNFEPSRIFL